MYGAATALDTLCSQAYTSGNIKMVGVYLQRAIIINLLGFIPIAYIWWESENILIFFRQSPEISAKAALYLRCLLIGTPAYLMFVNLERYLLAQAPISTSITYWLMLFFLVIYTKFINGYQAWGGWSRAAFRGWKPILTLMISGILMVCSEWWALECISFLAGYLGELSLASQGIITSILNMLYPIPFGVSVVASNRVGNLLGAGLVERAKMASKLFMQIAIIISLFNAAIMIGFKDILGLIKYTSYALLFTGLFVIPDGINTVGSGILRGQGRQNIGALLNAPGYFFVGIPIGILAAFKFKYGLRGLWIGEMTCSFMVCIILIIIVCRTDWQRQLEECKKRMKKDRDRFESIISNDPDF
ncbi:15690_t:CDS:2 [Cetraspora pellucida]|uniref:15690_t:CDS:1 n=1 Tax=Cetraspora pellucida TaxID=1433469 RepID=A0ACA9K880_9GLOM|nr:15690_t:CDS:2 [Cetraspora pellucida]